jgi:hypothetical protein
VRIVEKKNFSLEKTAMLAGPAALRSRIILMRFWAHSGTEHYLTDWVRSFRLLLRLQLWLLLRLWHRLERITMEETLTFTNATRWNSLFGLSTVGSGAKHLISCCHPSPPPHPSPFSARHPYSVFMYNQSCFSTLLAAPL